MDFEFSHTFLEKFKQNWWTTIWFYFHSFDEENHDIITGKSGNYWNFLNNLKLISASWLNSRCYYSYQQWKYSEYCKRCFTNILKL